MALIPSASLLGGCLPSAGFCVNSGFVDIAEARVVARRRNQAAAGNGIAATHALAGGYGAALLGNNSGAALLGGCLASAGLGNNSGTTATGAARGVAVGLHLPRGVRPVAAAAGKGVAFPAVPVGDHLCYGVEDMGVHVPRGVHSVGAVASIATGASSARRGGHAMAAAAGKGVAFPAVPVDDHRCYGVEDMGVPLPGGVHSVAAVASITTGASSARRGGHAVAAAVGKGVAFVPVGYGFGAALLGGSSSAGLGSRNLGTGRSVAIAAKSDDDRPFNSVVGKQAGKEDVLRSWEYVERNYHAEAFVGDVAGFRNSGYKATALLRRMLDMDKFSYSEIDLHAMKLAGMNFRKVILQTKAGYVQASMVVEAVNTLQLVCHRLLSAPPAARDPTALPLSSSPAYFKDLSDAVAEYVAAVEGAVQAQ